MRRITRFELAWIAAGVVLLTGLVWRAMAILGDGFWCLAAGDQVLRTGALPDLDPLAFTSRRVPWVLHMPAFQVGGAWLVAHAGLPSLMVASTVPIAAAASLLWLVPTRAAGPGPRLLALPVAVLYVLVDQEDISARGQAFGDLGLCLLLLLLSRLRRPNDGAPRASRPSRAMLLSALGLGAAWANFHPSFLLAVALPLGFAAAQRLDPPATRAPAAPFVWFAGLALLGACANPYSVVLVVDVLKLLGDPTTARVDLFLSPPFQDPGWLVPVALAVLLLVALARGAHAGHAASSGGRGRADAAVLLALVLAACGARRYVTALVAFEVILVAELLAASAHGAASDGGALAGAIRWPSASSPFWPRIWLAAGLVELAVGVAAMMEPKDPLRDVPAGAVAAIDEGALPDRVLNPYHWGGYLEWVWGGRRKAFIDGRNQLFSNGVFEDCEHIDRVAPDARWLLDVYEIRTVLWERGAPLDAALSQDPDFRLVYRDALAVVYVRR